MILNVKTIESVTDEIHLDKLVQQFEALGRFVRKHRDYVVALKYERPAVNELQRERYDAKLAIGADEIVF